jgi:cell division protein FtsB
MSGRRRVNVTRARPLIRSSRQNAVGSIKESEMFSRVIVLGVLIGSSAAALAQGTATPRIDQRQENQEKRIDQGVASGSLTEREAKRLDAREDRLEAHEAKAKADGVVTRKERARLHAETRRNSHAIARKKHNDRTAPGTH